MTKQQNPDSHRAVTGKKLYDSEYDYLMYAHGTSRDEKIYTDENGYVELAEWL